MLALLKLLCNKPNWLGWANSTKPKDQENFLCPCKIPCKTPFEKKNQNTLVHGEAIVVT